MNQFENEYEADTLSASQQALRVLKPTVLAVAMGCVGSAWAAQGGVVVNGTGNIATSGTTTTVTQSTDKMVVNWSNFDIAQGQTVKFAQPTTSAAVLNRVTGPVKASDIQGTLSANGRVYVVNPAGVMFGSTAVVNADSVVASTLDINAQQFMAGGRVAGNQKLLDLTSNAANASVVNQGQINARQVALLGANVVNKGTINATGDVTLGAADTATLSLTNSGFSVALDAPEVNALVDNGGVIVSKGGNVMLTAAATGDAVRNAVRSTGTIEARRATTGAGGSIELRSDADGQIAVGGKLTADDRVTVGTAPRITTGKGRSIVVDAITNLDQRTVNNTTQIDNITNQINNGGIGLVQQATPGSDVTVAKDTGGKAVNFTGTDGDRVLSGIAAGSADNEAVNVKQLKDAGVIDPSGHAKSVVTYDNTDKSSLTLGGEGASAPVAIHNVADGVGDRDAVNVGHPMYREGIAGVHEWDYLFKLPSPQGEVQCQYKVLFDDNMLTSQTFWNPAGCADLLGVAPPTVAPPTEPHVVQQLDVSADTLFGFDSAKLSADAPAALETVMNALDKAEHVDSLRVTGYTDRFGSASYNQQLSERRAQAVKAYLVARGVPGEAVMVQGHGAADPVVNCPGAKSAKVIECLKPNRRVRVEVVAR